MPVAGELHVSPPTESRIH